MYQLPHFTENDHQKVLGYMKAYPFALVSANGGDGFPAATHIPLMTSETDDGKIVLTGHIMKNTDHHRAFVSAEKVLVVFNGPHTYISASWYEKPGVASTWNYICVHCKGHIIFRDEEGTYEAIRALTDQYEGMNNPASFSRIDESYIRENLKAIIAFDIYVDTMRHVSKLSQNRTEQDQKNIITELHKRQDGQSASIAKEMEIRLTDQSTQKR